MTDELPLVSVLMPVRNEAVYLERSLNAVLVQDYPSERLEIIVADGRSTDGTQAVVRKCQALHSNITLIENHNRIAPTGLNLALAQARGEVIVRVDGHCEIAPDYIRRCVQHLQHSQAEGVGGSIETVGENWLARAIAIAMQTPFGVGGSTFRTAANQTLWVDTIPFPAFRRSSIERAGLYDEELVRNQDDEYNYRVRSLGGKLLLAADVRSRYYSRSNLSSLWRQYFQYGYWKVRVLQKHPRLMQPRQFIPAVFLLALGLSLLCAALFTWGILILAGVAGSYVLMNLLASSWSAQQYGWEYLPILPLIFAVLHLGYGLGFVVGLIRFWNRWSDRTGKTPAWQSTHVSVN